MSTKLSNAVTEAIQANLPGQVSGELKKYLEEAEVNKELILQQKRALEVKEVAVTENQKHIDRLKLEIQSLEKELNMLKWKKDKFDAAEKEVDQANFLKVTAEQVRDAYKDCFNIVFRNAQVKRQVLGTENNPSEYSNTPSQYGTQTTSSSFQAQPYSETETREDVG